MRYYLLCLLKRATMFPSLDHTTYLTRGVANSATIFCCWISNKTTEFAVESNKLAVPPKKMSTVCTGHLIVFVIELSKSLISIDCAVLSKTANRFLATNKLEVPFPLFPSVALSRISPSFVGSRINS